MFSKEREFKNWKLSGFSNHEAILTESTESTHSLMKQLAASGKIPPGTLIVANQQTSGRGRHERTWESPANENIYFNILIPLEGIPLSSAPQITQVAALTFAEIFRDIQASSDFIINKEKANNFIGGINNNYENRERVTVKWPNDILCGKSKFCGILAEVIYIPCSEEAEKRESPKPALNMGVGINVNSSPKNFAFLNRPVTTLKEIARHSINREKLLQLIIGNLERAIGQFRAFGLSPWIEAWRKMDQFIGARGTIIVNNNCTDENRNTGAGSIKKSGRIIDMQPDGSLLFQTDDGKIETVYSADLEI